ncbi:MAG: DUF302 domain-containing protein [Deltaproteobacteria bacterium]|nr:DUF302 domain-containing protein [Deltaproteobacteria bacterium]
MSYYFSKKLSLNLEQAFQKVEKALKEEGFGILTQVDVQATFKKKLQLDFRPYLILGACNPTLAHQALSQEDKIGTMLPCNVIIQQISPHEVEVAAVDPVASMQAVSNPKLAKIATEVRGKLEKVIDSL